MQAHFRYHDIHTIHSTPNFRIFFRQIAVENLRKRLVNENTLRRGMQRRKSILRTSPLILARHCIERSKTGLTMNVHRVWLLLCARVPNVQDWPSTRLILRFYCDGENRAQRDPFESPIENHYPLLSPCPWSCLLAALENVFRPNELPLENFLIRDLRNRVQFRIHEFPS